MAQLKSLIVNGVSRFNNTTYSNIAYNDTTYSTNGFVKVGFDDSNVLLAGGGTRSLDWFAHEHEHPYLPIAGGTMTGAINVSFASDASWDARYGLNFGTDGETGHIGNDAGNLALYAKRGIDLFVEETNLPHRVSQTYGLKITSSDLLYSSQNGTDKKVWHEGNDGSGSGLDADLLDGQHGDYYAKSSWMASYLALSGGVMTGAITSSVGSSMIDKTKGINFGTASSYGAHLGYNGGNFGIFSANKIIIVPGANVNGGTQPSNQGLELTSTTIKFNNQKVWYEGNDGSGSGLHADLLDGQHGSYYAPIASPAFTGTPTAVTAAAGTNTTQLATTQFVTTAVSNAIGQIPTYKIKKLDNPTADTYIASYKLYSVLNGVETAIEVPINIPKDYLVKSGEVKTVTTANNPYSGAAVGDKYLDFVVNTAGNDGTTTHIYIPVKDLVDVYTGGAAISVSSNNKISAYLNSNNKHGLEITANGIGLNLASSSSAGALSSTLYDKLVGINLANYLPLAGGVMTGAITSSVGTSIIDKTKGINFGTASSYGGHIGYVNSGAMGMYAKDKITIVPGVDINAQTNPTNSGLELTTTSIKFNNNTVWHAGNDGHKTDGSGPDADMLDGHHGSEFLLKTGGTITGDLTVEGNTTLGNEITDKLLINSTGYVLGAGNYDGTNENDPHTFSMQKLLTRTLYKKEYESYTPLTGDSTTANTTLYSNGGYLFFMQVHPQSTNFYEPWHVKYRLYVNKVSGSNNDYYKGYYDCYISQEGTTVTYAFFNEFYSSSYRPIYYHLMLSPNDTTKWNQRGYDSTTGLCSHPIWIGADVYNAQSPKDARYYRIEVYEVHNCKITFPDTIQHYDKVRTGDSTYDNGIYSSTYYYTARTYNGCNQGLQESGDNDNTTSQYNPYIQLLAGANGIKQNSLVMQDSTGAWQSFTITHGTGTSKPKNTAKFRLGSRIYYYAGSNVAAGAYTNTSTLYENISLANFKYSINITETTGGANNLLPKKPLYIVGTIDANKYFNLADVWWTQTEPTTEDGKVYIKVCESIYTDYSNDRNYRGDLLSDGKPMWFKDGLFRPYPESKPKFEAGTAQNTIKLIHGNETSADFMIAYAINADTLDGMHASELATAHDHPYLPLAGGVLTGGVTVPTGSSMIKKTMGINFGAANSYGGHLGYIQAGDLGMYTKRDIYLVPNSNVQGESGDNTKGLKLSSSDITFNSKKVWWEDNDGHKLDGSGPDADLLDGLHATELLTNVEMYAGGNSTKIDVTVGGTTLTGSLIVPYASNAGNVDWENISNLPEVFPAAPHDHDDIYVNVTGDTMTGALTINNNLTVTGNTTLGDTSTDRHKINGITTAYNDVILYSASGDSPSLIFNRASSSLTDWKMYVKNGNLYFASATNAATWTDRVYIQDQTNKIYAYFVGNLHGHVQGDVAGNATTATTLATTRTIWGQNFNGSANVTGDMTSVGSISASGAITTTKSDTTSLKVSTKNSNGEVGIYTSTDRGLYDFTGSKWIISTGGSGTYTFLGLGNVAIGTNTTPTVKLDVAGSIKSSDTVQAVKFRTTSYEISQTTGGRLAFGTHSQAVAAPVNVGNLLVSNSWSDYTNVPTNGIYAKGNIKTAAQLISSVATGTAPLAVSSNTLVTNLNADMLDGKHASEFSISSHDHDDRYVNVTGDTMSGALTINSNLTVTGNATINGNTTIGDTANDTLTINAKTTSYNDIELRTNTNSADSPSLIFNRTGGSNIDWKTYVSGGHFYLSSASDASTWTTRVWVDYNNGNINGNLVGNVTGNVTGNLYGNADTATKLKTARTISLTGAVTGSGSFNGSANLSISTSVNHQHNYAGSSTYGGAANTVVVTDTNENATRNMVFHNGSSLYSTTDITCNPSTDELTAKKLRAKANDMYVGSATGAQCHMQYDSTMKCIKFMFD